MMVWDSMGLLNVVDMAIINFWNFIGLFCETQ